MSRTFGKDAKSQGALGPSQRQQTHIERQQEGRPFWNNERQTEYPEGTAARTRAVLIRALAIDAVEGTPGDFTVNLNPQPVVGIHGGQLTVVSVTLPLSYWMLEANLDNQTFYFAESGLPSTGTTTSAAILPAGNYTAPDLAIALAAAMTVASQPVPNPTDPLLPDLPTATYTGTWNESTGVITIVTSVSGDIPRGWSMNQQSALMATMTGFVDVPAISTNVELSQTATYVPVLGPAGITLEMFSQALAPYSDSSKQGIYTNVLASMPINQGLYQQMIYNPNFQRAFPIPSGGGLTSLRLRFRRSDDNSIVNFHSANGAGIEVDLMLQYNL